EDVQPRSEAQFADREPGSAFPGGRQAAALQEHRSRFRQAVLGGEIDVVIEPRAGLPVLAPCERPFGGGGSGLLAHRCLGYRAAVCAAGSPALSAGLEQAATESAATAAPATSSLRRSSEVIFRSLRSESVADAY